MALERLEAGACEVSVDGGVGSGAGECGVDEAAEIARLLVQISARLTRIEQDQLEIVQTIEVLTQVSDLQRERINLVGHMVQEQAREEDYVFTLFTAGATLRVRQ